MCIFKNGFSALYYMQSRHCFDGVSTAVLRCCVATLFTKGSAGDSRTLEHLLLLERQSVFESCCNPDVALPRRNIRACP